MNIKRFQRAFAPLLLSVMLLLTACGGTATSPSVDVDAPAQTTTTSPVDATPQKGSAFNKFLPSGGGGYDTTFTQEKEGFAEVKLTKGGTEMAKISISDTANNLAALSKFDGANDSVSGFPVVAQGSKATAALVGDRYQVKVMSRNDSFTAADREAWLQKVDLQGLARLN
ncbi:MAG: hypothetical protein WBB82_14010 [Limnothrix sp.]